MTCRSTWRKGRTIIDKQKNAGYVLSYTGLALLLCLVIMQIPLLAFPATVFWGFILLLLAYRVSGRASAVAAVIGLAFVFLLTGYRLEWSYNAMLMLPVAFMAWWMPRKETAREARGAILIVMLLAVAYFLGAAYYYLGTQGLDEVERDVSAMADDSLYSPENAFLMELYKNQGISIDQFEQSFAEVMHWMFRLIPALFVLRSLAGIMLAYILAGWWARRHKLAGPPDLQYSREILPWQAVWVVIAGLSMWLLDWNYRGLVFYTGANLLFFAMWVTAYYGLAVFVYWRQQAERPLNPWVVLVMIVSVLLVPHFYIMLAALIGLFDALLDYRKLRPQKEEEL